MRVCTLIFFAILSGAVTGSGTAAYVVSAVSARASEAVLLPAPVAPASVSSSAIPPGTSIAPVARGVADVFARQLHERVNGRLVSLDERDGQLAVRWTSPTCDWKEMEILDLVEAVARQFPSTVAGIDAVRECAGTVRRYTVNARTYARYHSGDVSSPDVLRYLIESDAE